MSNTQNDQLLDLIDQVLSRATYVSEMWVGTLHSKMIDAEVAQLKLAVDLNDLEKAHELVHHLAATVQDAEAAYEM